MKYDSLRKTERDKQIASYSKKHPGLSQKEIGQVFGISHARISQILKKYGEKNG